MSFFPSCSVSSWLRETAKRREEKKTCDTYTGDYGRFAGCFFVCSVEVCFAAYFISSFISKRLRRKRFHSWTSLALFCVRSPHSWNLNLSSLNLLKKNELRCETSKSIFFYHEKFEYSMDVNHKRGERKPNRLKKLTIWRQMKKEQQICWSLPSRDSILFLSRRFAVFSAFQLKLTHRLRDLIRFRKSCCRLVCLQCFGLFFEGRD